VFLGYPGKQQPAPGSSEFERYFVVPGIAVGLFILWPFAIQARPGQFKPRPSHGDGFSCVTPFMSSFLYKMDGPIFTVQALAQLRQCRELAIPGLRSWRVRPAAGSCFVLSWGGWLTSFLLIRKRRQELTRCGCSESRRSLCCFHSAAWLVAKVDYPCRFCLPLIPLFTNQRAAVRVGSSLLVFLAIISSGSDSDDCDGCRGRLRLSLNTKYFRYNALTDSLDVYRCHCKRCESRAGRTREWAAAGGMSLK